MIVVQINGYGAYQTEISPNLTVKQLVQNLKDDLQVQFRSSYSLQETTTGRTLSDDEIIVDERLYNLNAWVMK